MQLTISIDTTISLLVQMTDAGVCDGPAVANVEAGQGLRCTEL